MAYPRTAIPRHDLILIPFTILFLTLSSSSSARLLLNKTANTTTSKVVGVITDCDDGCCTGVCNPDFNLSVSIKRSNTMKPDRNTRPLAVNKTENTTNTTKVNGVSALTIGGCDNGGCSGGGVGIGISVPMPRISIPFPSINIPGISIGPGISIPGVSIGGGGSSCSVAGGYCYETPPCNNCDHPSPSAPSVNPTPTPSPSVNPTPSPYIPVKPTPTPSPSVNPTPPPPCHNCVPVTPHCPNCNPVTPPPPCPSCAPSEPCAPPHHCEGGVCDMDQLLQLNGTTNNHTTTSSSPITFLPKSHGSGLMEKDVKNPVIHKADKTAGRLHMVKPKRSAVNGVNQGTDKMSNAVAINGQSSSSSGGTGTIDQDDDYLHLDVKRPTIIHAVEQSEQLQSRVHMKKPMHIVKPKSSGELVGTDIVGGGRIGKLVGMAISVPPAPN